MIGNDIVDLQQAAKDSNWQRPRFLDKVFTKEEQKLISNSEDKHQMVWLLWSMKEAAYKVNVQQFEKRFFNPKRLVCKLFSFEKGMVSIDNESYFTSSEITEDYVYTVATLNEEKKYKTHCFKMEQTDFKLQSQFLKKQLLTTVAKIENYNIKELMIKKTEVGVPQLFNNFEKLLTSFSLTHCGRYSGFVYL
ncbi:4'-phosphopantetheinyl transferase family protein [Lacinutrix jangbogonensis]|uniref:4'-phosphopantetheinyl transferase family protein n=1 Tax=Lacinutrix jangbogonensis TaxID=1469557 RepID=UPI00053DED4C|nr:4'-phosphopantetheinyl transferase superfamily protein [Lacinutrix jangbogonensis]